jgi:hypothetical protein
MVASMVLIRTGSTAAMISNRDMVKVLLLVTVKGTRLDTTKEAATEVNRDDGGDRRLKRTILVRIGL